MLKRMTLGLASGAVGTAALNLVTYLDMFWRGRPASELPAQTAGELAGRLGMPFPDDGDETAESRKSALGALLGYASGLGVGALYGVARRPDLRVPNSAAGAIVGLGAMAVTDGPMAALGLTDPREWDAASWLSDLIPHLVYGTCTVLAFEAFTS